MIETHLDKSRQAIKLGLIKIIPELFPGESFRTLFSIGKGVYCELAKTSISKREIARLSVALKEWAEKGNLIHFLFKKNYYYYRVGDIIVKTIHPVELDPRKVADYRLIPFSPGFIIDFEYKKEDEGKPYSLPKKLSEAYWVRQKWLTNLGLEMSYEVNSYISSGRSGELINTGEAIHHKQLSTIGDMITEQRRNLRIVLISGPSASGKTIVARRLLSYLRISGLKPRLLKLDNYFLDIEQRPCDEQGNIDFDSLKALDLALLQEHVEALLEGKQIETPIFDYVAGKRSNLTQPMHLGKDELLVIKGIHALNPNLLAVDNHNILFKIYLSSLFGVNVDRMNRVPSTEARLIRRMVRGDMFRGVSPEQTFAMWPNIRKGEINNVFKFQEDCDVIFNSSLIYELNALRPYAEAALNKIPDDSPHYEIKIRLLDLLAFFEPLKTATVPPSSVLREYIGGSTFATEETIKMY
ncbi:MAG: nucleoside kinase [Desulfitobacteriaceae bacterium]|nr:nucleoside kinase [Desulfitobacteriaceae bacterium]MDD4346582.1 nucleoside kinase [Desulfitobacteriaceae bacterium]MDD4401562.1 nucleoside kinase [Desulfitobacteriaceae bacterium]